MSDEETFEGICIDRTLPLELLPEAERLAAEENPDNAIKDTEEAEKLAFVGRKRWAPGRHLKIRFLDGTPTMQQRVIDEAQVWVQHANIILDFGEHPQSDIRISFHADRGSWSAVGTDALLRQHFPLHQPTMNFGWLRDGSSDLEWSRVVLHEFGHALGAIHEHQTPDEPLEWNEEEVLKYFSGPPNNWNEASIRHNVLRRYDVSSVRGSSFDPDSIMLYGFPGFLFKNGVGTKSNHSLSAQDKLFAALAYPR